MNGNKQAVNVENRQRVNQHVAALLRRAPAPIIFQHPRITEQIAVRQHRAFAAARGAAGVENRGQIVRLFNSGGVLVAAVGGARQERAGAVVVEREDVLCAGVKGDFADPAKVGAAAHDDGRLGVTDEIFDFCALVSGVERQKHITGAQRGQIKHNSFNGFFDLHGDAGTVGQAQRLQQIGHHGAAAL